VAAARWWKLLVTGTFVLGAVMVVTSITGELSEPGWLVAMVAILAGLTLLGAGAVLGVVRLSDRRRAA
jgi:hypothetical protein